MLPHGPASSLRPLKSSVLCASHNAYLIDPESQNQPPNFTASTNPVHTIMDAIPLTGRSTTFLTAAESDRFISVFNADTPTSIGSLRLESEALHLDLYSGYGGDRIEVSQSLEARMQQPQETLAALNKDGLLEIFPEPFDFGSLQTGSHNLKARMKQRTRKASAQVRIVRPDMNSAPVPLVNACFKDSEIALAWAEGGVNLFFENIKWRDEGTGHLLLKGITEVVKSKSGAGVGAIVMDGVKDMEKTHVDDSHTVIANGGDTDDVSLADEQLDVISISSGEEGSDSEEEEIDAPAGSLEAQKVHVAGEGGESPDEDKDVTMDDADRSEMKNAADQDKEDEESGGPSFGDLVQGNAPEPVDVEAAFTDPNTQSLVPTGVTGLQQAPSGMSLGTVLTQSLRTNDTNLLETCFHVKDLSTIRATIERLDSSYATILLQRLAERLHSRPGRAGSLMVWIQWTLVVHGGHLAGQPEILKKLASLHRVVKDRAKSLQPLLSLKGKLDMLEAQMNLRKSTQARNKTANDFEEEEEGVVYVEGQEDFEEDDEDEEEAVEDALDSRPAKAGARAPNSAEADDSDAGEDADSEQGSEESENEMVVTTNGIVADSEDSESEEGLFDEEASFTDHESRDEESEDEVDHESIDSVDTSNADTSPPPKRPAKAKLSNGVRSRLR